MFVATGQPSDSEMSSSIEILTEESSGAYKTKNINVGSCSAVPDFPLATTLAIGALFNDLPHVCVGYKTGEPSTKCFGFKADGSWENDFNLTRPLEYGGSSAAFGDWKGVKTPWWVFGAEPNGKGTEVYGGNPPAEISKGKMKLPTIINQPCMTKIGDHEVFVTSIPQNSTLAKTNLAWIFNIESNTWKPLPNTKEKRYGAACGFLKTGSSGRFVVLAGGDMSSTTEILNLDALRRWTTGPSIGVDLYGESMVSVRDGQELLLVGGYSSRSGVLSEIRD